MIRRSACWASFDSLSASVITTTAVCELLFVVRRNIKHTLERALLAGIKLGRLGNLLEQLADHAVVIVASLAGVHLDVVETGQCGYLDFLVGRRLPRSVMSL